MLNEPLNFISTKSVSASKYLREKCPAPNNVIFKNFAQQYCKSRSTRLVSEPNLVSVKNILKKLFNGFERITGTLINQELKDDVYFMLKKNETSRSRKYLKIAVDY
jgi:hypothetical protein